MASSTNGVQAGHFTGVKHARSSKRYLVRFKTTDRKHFGNFRLQELIALAELSGLDSRTLDLPASLSLSCPYVALELPSEEFAHRIAERSVLIEGFYELWAEADDLESLRSAVSSCAYMEEARSHPRYADMSFRLRVRPFHRRVPQKEILATLMPFTTLGLAGRVQMKDPDHSYCIHTIFDLATHINFEHKLLKCFFTRRISKSARRLCIEFSLKQRDFIGPTSTDAELAFLMANQAHCRRGSLVYDPFVGTGSILVACAAFGSATMGSDIDYRILRGKDGLNLLDNFRQYKLPLPDLVRSDNSRPVYRASMKLDAVVCDPPYGIRAGARKGGTAKAVHPIPEEYLADHAPRTQVYEVEDVMNDLLEMCARYLRVGGRLVYLLPTTPETRSDPRPSHPCLKLVGDSEQQLAGELRRHLITMVKVSEPADPEES